MNSQKEIVLDLQESIEKHLPSQVGEALQKRLKKVDKLEEENSKLSSDLSEAQRKIKKLEGALREHRSLDEKYDDLRIREEEVFEREKKMDVHDATLRADEAEKRAELAKGYVETVFKSPVYRSTITGYSASREHGGSFDKTTTEVVD